RYCASALYRLPDPDPGQQKRPDPPLRTRSQAGPSDSRRAVPRGCLKISGPEPAPAGSATVHPGIFEPNVSKHPKINSMLKCSTSLWSADLANLGAEIRRVEPYSERFHVDVADGHYVHNLLFFPDQVKALRIHTAKPFEVHLMVTDPLGWIEPFVEAGADGILFCFDAARDAGQVLKTIKATGKEA